jgi:hypothetical protein
MTHSRFWRCIALALVAGLFYVGHGLRDPSPLEVPLPSIATQARADVGVTSVPYQDNHSLIVTASDDGKTIYVWDATMFLSGSTLRYVGTYTAKE